MSATNPVGIKAYSVFLPRLRMARSAIAPTHAWAFSSMRSKGQKALCTWDEDARALAVEASRDCQNDERSGIEMPDPGLHHCTLYRPAKCLHRRFGLFSNTQCADSTGSNRIGVLSLLKERHNPAGENRLVVGSARCPAKPASLPQELHTMASALAQCGWARSNCSHPCWAASLLTRPSSITTA